MHIRSFIGAALLGLAMLAFAPLAMADPLPDICVLDLSPSVTVDHSFNTAPDLDCHALAAVVPSVSTFSLMGGDQGEAAWPIAAVTPHKLDHTVRRMHFDPGRMAA